MIRRSIQCPCLSERSEGIWQAYRYAFYFFQRHHLPRLAYLAAVTVDKVTMMMRQQLWR